MEIAIIFTISSIIFTIMVSMILLKYIRMDILKIKYCVIELNSDDYKIDIKKIKKIRNSINFKNLNVIKEELDKLDILIEEEILLRELRKNIKQAKIEESQKIIQKIEIIQKKL